jgi:hypothetical protein
MLHIKIITVIRPYEKSFITKRGGGVYFIDQSREFIIKDTHTCGSWNINCSGCWYVHLLLFVTKLFTGMFGSACRPYTCGKMFKKKGRSLLSSVYRR